VQAARTRFGLADPEAARQQQQQQQHQPTGPKASPAVKQQDALDFRSPHFNPLLALNTPGVIPPIPNARPLDNISAFRNLLPQAHPDHRDRAKRSTTPVPAKASSRRATTSTVKQEIDLDSSTTINVMASTTVDEKAAAATSHEQYTTKAQQDPLQVVMALAVGEHAKGPMSLLMRLYKENRRVCIMIRNVNSIRGVCTGLLKAFDKHFNVILTDVTEEYTITVNAAAATSAGGSISSNRDSNSSRSNNATTVRRQRYLKQLLIRGDNVVMCWAATAAAAASMCLSADSSSSSAIT
jgi:small nuclear ribonucleoprotein (snRNP)-like protein